MRCLGAGCLNRARPVLRGGAGSNAGPYLTDSNNPGRLHRQPHSERAGAVRTGTAGVRGTQHPTDGEAVFIPVSEPDGACDDWGYAPDPAALRVSRRTPGGRGGVEASRLRDLRSQGGDFPPLTFYNLSHNPIKYWFTRFSSRSCLPLWMPTVP